MRTWLILLVVTVLVAATVAKKDKKNKKDACRYEKGGNKWTACTDGKMSITKSLKEGSGSHCSDTKKIERPCVEGCKYRYKGKWDKTCQKGVKERRRQVSLMKNGKQKTRKDPCPETLTEVKQCPGRCDYKINPWSECDPVTNMRKRTLTLKETNTRENYRPEVVKEVECREKGPKKGPKNAKKNWRKNQFLQNYMAMLRAKSH